MIEKKDKDLQLIPAGEKKCIWMEAGVVSYKVCFNNYHCSSCPFDHVLLEIACRETNSSRMIKVKKDRREKDRRGKNRRKKENTYWIEEFNRLPAC